MSSVTCRLATIRTGGVARVHIDKKSHQPWPGHVVEQTLAAGDPVLRLGLCLLLFTGQREGDVVRMKWGDIREYDGQEEIRVVQEKTGTKIWVPLHRDLKALLDVTPRASDYILNSTWGRPFASSQSLYEKIKQVLKRTGNGNYVPHGLRATAAVRLIEAGCSEDQAAAITGHRNMNVLRGYLRGVNQPKLARQAIGKQESAGMKAELRSQISGKCQTRRTQGGQTVPNPFENNWKSGIPN